MLVGKEKSSQKKPQRLFFKHIIRKVFLEDWAIKLVALAITLGLWFGVTGLSTPTTERLTVPLYSSISNNAVVMNSLRQEVEIVISGDKRKLDQIVKSDVSAAVDLTSIATGDWVIPLSPDTVSVTGLPPQGVKLIEVRPNNMGVHLEGVAEKDVDVKSETSGNPAVGYEVYMSSVLPPKIRVRGPASVIGALIYVQTDKIDIAGKKEDFTAKQISVTAANPMAAVLNTVVDVYFRIGEKRIERAFTVPVSGLPGKTARFAIYGPRTLLSKAKADTFKVEMHLDHTGVDAPQVILPAELQDLVEVRKLRLGF